MVLCALTPPVSATSAQALVEQASPFAHKGQYDQAEPLYRRALALMTKAPPADQDSLKECLSWLGYINESKNNLAEAEHYFKRALEVEEKNAAGHNDPYEELLAMTLDDLAQIYTKQGKYSAAKALEMRSLKMREHTYGVNSREYRLVLERLSEIDKHLGDTTSVNSLTKQILDIKVKQYGPVLGPFYARAQRTMQNNRRNCVVPSLTVVGVGSNFSQFMAAAELTRLWGRVAPWYKIPNWLAGLWRGPEEVPKDNMVEMDGELYQETGEFGSSHGAYARRKGAVQTVDGWWDRLKPGDNDYWTWSTNSEQFDTTQSNSGSKNPSGSGNNGVGAQKLMEYSFWRTHTPVTTADGLVIYRDTAVHYLVKLMPPLLPFLPENKVVKSIWQIDREEVFGQVGVDKKTGLPQIAMYTATRIYDANGNQVSEAPDRNSAFDDVSMPPRIGAPGPKKFRDFDARSNLMEFLIFEGKFDEVKKLK